MLVFQMVSSENAVYAWIWTLVHTTKKQFIAMGGFFRGRLISSHLYESISGGGSISSRL